MALVGSDICFPLLGNGLGVHSVETIRLAMRNNRYGVSNNDSHLPFSLKNPYISRGYLVLSSDNKAILLCFCGAWAMRNDSFKNRAPYLPSSPIHGVILVVLYVIGSCFLIYPAYLILGKWMPGLMSLLLGGR